MSVSLVTDVPYELIFRGVENIVKGHGQFDDTEAGTEMTAVYGNIVNDKVSELFAQLHQLRLIEFLQIVGAVNGSQKFSRPYQTLIGLTWSLIALIDFPGHLDFLDHADLRTTLDLAIMAVFEAVQRQSSPNLAISPFSAGIQCQIG